MRRLFSLSLVLLVLLAVAPVRAGEDPAVPLRLGLVRFGSGAWVIDSARAHGLDRAAGIAFAVTDLASPAAGEIALQAGGVDAIVSDWLWVSRQRRAGQRIVFLPQSAALGEILVPAASPIHQLADLAGQRLGIAGGPLDKSWLLLRAASRRVLGEDLAERITPVYAAPPLLSRELAAGRLDAVLTFWPFAARLAARGDRSIATLADLMGTLGFPQPVPLLGYAVREDWIAAHPDGLDRLRRAAAAANALLASDDGEWNRLRPLTAAEDDATLTALRDRFRAGIVRAWSPEQAERLFTILAETGGADLTGGAREIAPGTFR